MELFGFSAIMSVIDTAKKNEINHIEIIQAVLMVLQTSYWLQFWFNSYQL